MPKIQKTGFQDMPPERLREISSAAGKKSRSKENLARLAAKEEEKKTIRNALEWALSLPIDKFYSDSKYIRQVASEFPNATYKEALAAVAVLKAMEGDVKSLQVIRDSVGELPTQTVNVKTEEPMEIKITTVE